MTLTAIYAQLACTDLALSTEWFATLFGRKSDARPMERLAEWHHGGAAGFQLYEDAPHAGQGTLTLIVSDVRAEHARLTRAGIEAGSIEPADSTTIARLCDPDGNLVVLAQPGRA